MFELVGGRSVMPVADKISSSSGKGASFGLDFAGILQQAEQEQVAPAPPAPSAKPADGVGERADRKVRADQAAEAPDDEGDSAQKGEQEGEENAESGAAAALLAQRGMQQNVEEEDVEESIAIDEDAPAWQEVKAPTGDVEVEDIDLDGVELDAAEVEVPTAVNGVPVVPADDPLELLNVVELMDPDLTVEKGTEQIVTRIVQAAGSQAPVMEELAESVLPQVIRSVAALVRGGGAEMRLQLQPADLGEIELRVRTTEAAVRGEFVVTNPEVKHLLEQHVGRLRAALAQEGLDLQGFSVDVGDHSAFTERGDDQEEAAHARANGNGMREGPAETTSIPTPVRRPDSGDVDFTA